MPTFVEKSVLLALSYAIMRAVDALAVFVNTSATKGSPFGLERHETEDLQRRRRHRLEVLALRGRGLCFQPLPGETLLRSW